MKRRPGIAWFLVCLMTVAAALASAPIFRARTQELHSGPSGDVLQPPTANSSPSVFARVASDSRLEGEEEETPEPQTTANVEQKRTEGNCFRPGSTSPPWLRPVQILKYLRPTYVPTETAMLTALIPRR